MLLLYADFFFRNLAQNFWKKSMSIWDSIRKPNTTFWTSTIDPMSSNMLVNLVLNSAQPMHAENMICSKKEITRKQFSTLENKFWIWKILIYQMQNSRWIGTIGALFSGWTRIGIWLGLRLEHNHIRWSWRSNMEKR